MLTIVFVIVVFSGADQVGALLEATYRSLHECQQVAAVAHAIAAGENRNMRFYCVAKKTEKPEA